MLAAGRVCIALITITHQLFCSGVSVGLAGRPGELIPSRFTQADAAHNAGCTCRSQRPPPVSRHNVLTLVWLCCCCRFLLSAESSLVCGVAGPNHQHLPPHPQHLLGSSTKADSTQNGVKDPAWLYALGEWHRPDCVGLLGCPPCRASSLLQVIILDTCLGIA